MDLATRTAPSPGYVSACARCGRDVRHIPSARDAGEWIVVEPEASNLGFVATGRNGFGVVLRSLVGFDLDAGYVLWAAHRCGAGPRPLFGDEAAPVDRRSGFAHHEGPRLPGEKPCRRCRASVVGATVVGKHLYLDPQPNDAGGFVVISWTPLRIRFAMPGPAGPRYQDHALTCRAAARPPVPSRPRTGPGGR